ncbi:helix-turn-helix domain-containing protein [Niallia sp. FSL W8-0635]|uniref:helix-turn-helix domain-containing protein n=1 Tax=Niallia sp. FSL W8-0635 TaxID=2975337 RepID=UPI0030F76D32
MEKTKPYGTVLLKAAKIMDSLAENPNKTLQDISIATNMTNSTTLKILDTLLLIGYVCS